MHNQVKTTTYNGRLYAVFEATARMYCYHPRNNKWRAQAPMSKIWCPKSFTTAGDYLFVVGMGCNPYEDFIERFDPQSNSWSVVRMRLRKENELELKFSCLISVKCRLSPTKIWIIFSPRGYAFHHRSGTHAILHEDAKMEHDDGTEFDSLRNQFAGSS